LFRDKLLSAGILVLAITTAQITVAATLEVPEQYPTIAAALAEAGAGDTVKIAPGRYYEHGLVLPAQLTIQGTGQSPQECIIDAGSQGRILTAEFTTGLSRIENLTFANGFASMDEGYGDSGGAIYINSSPMRLYNCRFEGNRASGSGGAVRCMRASALIINCFFQDNHAGEGGGALDFSYSADPLVQNSGFHRNRAGYGGAFSCRGDSQPYFNKCRFDQNVSEGSLALGGAVLSFFWGNPTFTECTFSRNVAAIGGALYSDANSPANLTSCTVVFNTAHSYGAGLYTENASPEIKNSIIAFQDGIGILSLGTSYPEITCTNIFGNTDGDWFGSLARQATAAGNMTTDPLFCATNLDEEYLFNLQDDSPCAAENGACADMGAWPIGCNDSLDAVGVENFTARWRNGVPLITWEMEATRGALTFRLARVPASAPLHQQDVPYGIDTEGTFVAEDTALVPEEGESYLYQLYLVAENGAEMLLDTAQLSALPRNLYLQEAGAWPNPFNPQTTIHFELASSQQVRVDIYGIDGRLVRSLARENYLAGPHNLVWNGQDDTGRVMSSGPYVVVITGEKDSRRLKVTLLK
jgi:predicted outer membrane repeat protein